jgi:hypothetical protein
MQNNFNPSDDAIAIKQSLTKPKNMNTLIHIIAHRSNEQRQEIKKQYYEQNQKNLMDDLKKELSGNFQDAAIALFYSPIDYDCYQLYKAMKGLGTNEDTLIEIIATRSNERINQIKQRYYELYKKDLIKDIENDTSGFFRQILKKLLEANRSNNTFPDEKESENCARQIFDATSQKKEVLQQTFIYIFTQKSREELASISKVYFKWYSKTLFEIIEKLFSGDAKRILKAIVYALLSPSEYFAYRINKAIKGLGTNDTILIRVLVSRDEIDIGRIKRYYKQLYQKDLYTAVKDDVSGDYRNLLLELIGN